MGTRSSIIFRLLFVTVLCFFSINSNADDNENIKILSKFWEYDTNEVKNAISTPLKHKFSSDKVSKLSYKMKKSYLMLLSASCISENVNDYIGVYRYKCLNKSMHELFKLSLKEPKVFLFTRKQDVRIVIGYLNRYTQFLKNEAALKDGMPIETSFREYLISIKQILVEMYPE